MFGKTKNLFLFAILALLLCSCHFQTDVRANQVGVYLNRNDIEGCTGPGVYTRWGYWEEMTVVDRNTITFSVGDPEVATQDNQLVGVTITIQARRNADCSSITNLLENWPALRDDQALIDTITATAKEGIKVGTREFTLQELLDDRNGLSGSIKTQLQSDSDKYGVEIVNVTIENVALAVEYAQLMQEKALLTAAIDKAVREQDLILQKASNSRLEQQQNAAIYTEQLAAEQAKTAVDVEIATRAGKVTAAANEVYKLNQQAYELERLRLLAQVFGNKATMWFVDPNVNLTLLLSGQGQVVPLPVNGESPQ
jgi:hypothetical protein